MALSFQRDALVRLDGNRLSDHNRTPVERTPERIENKTRTARGRLRKSYIADKWSFSMSWDMLPENDAATVDGFWGAQSLIDFYKNTPGEFEITLENSDGTQDNYTVVFTEFSYSVTQRWQRYYYDVSLGVEEV